MRVGSSHAKKYIRKENFTIWVQDFKMLKFETQVLIYEYVLPASNLSKCIHDLPLGVVTSHPHQTTCPWHGRTLTVASHAPAPTGSRPTGCDAAVADPLLTRAPDPRGLGIWLGSQHLDVPTRHRESQKAQRRRFLTVPNCASNLWESARPAKPREIVCVSWPGVQGCLLLSDVVSVNASEDSFMNIFNQSSDWVLGNMPCLLSHLPPKASSMSHAQA